MDRSLRERFPVLQIGEAVTEINPTITLMPSDLNGVNMIFSEGRVHRALRNCRGSLCGCDRVRDGPKRISLLAAEELLGNGLGRSGFHEDTASERERKWPVRDTHVCAVSGDEQVGWTEQRVRKIMNK